MYGDQFGEFVCGYWGLRVKSLTRSRYDCGYRANKTPLAVLSKDTLFI